MQRRLIIFSTAVSALALASPAMAADQPAGTAPLAEQQSAAAAEAGTQGNDIIVTAARRTQSLKDVPLSVSAVGQDEINKRGIQTILDLSRAVPGLVVNEAGPGENRIFLRGVANPNNLTSLVGVYVDEIPVTGQSLGQPDLQLVDLDRVEVLRGPQGTLYGQGAAGGTIRFITAKPVLDRVFGEVTATGYATEKGDPSGRFTGTLNLPVVTDVLGLRISGTYADIGGWIDQPAANRRDINNQSLKDVRIKGLLHASESLNVEASVNIHRNSGDGLTYGADADYNVAFPGGNPTAKERFVDNFEIYNLTANYDFGGVKLLSSTSYIDSHKISRGIAQKYLGVETFNSDDFKLRQFAQELRLSGGSTSGLSWVVGGYYTNDKLNRLLTIDYYFGGMPLGVFPTPSTDKSETISGYGDASYAITPRLTLGAGLRYFHDDRRGITAASDARAKFHSLDPRFYGSYALSDSAKLYFNVAKGFRSGGFEGDPSGGRYGPEKVWSYEGGIKGATHTLRWEFSGYYSTYTGYQAFALTNPPFGGIVNAGTAHIKGVDFDIAYTPIPALSLSVSGNVNDGHLVRVLPGDLSNLNGDRVDYVPDYSVTASAEYRFDWSAAMPGFARLDYSQVGPASYTERSVGVIAYKTDTLNLLNARLGATLGGWSVELFGENLTGEHGVQDPLYVIGTGSRPRPRTGGVRAAVKF